MSGLNDLSFEPELKSVGRCKICGWGAEKYESLGWTYGERPLEFNAFGSSYARWVTVTCGKCDFKWLVPLKDEVRGDAERFAANPREKA